MLRGELTADEIVECARAAVESVNPDLNALTLPLLDEPQEYDADGCLAGVPLLIKDSSPFARGMPFSLGSRAIRGAVATQDHQLMTGFRSAGLAALGQTTAPERALPPNLGGTASHGIRGRWTGAWEGPAAVLLHWSLPVRSLWRMATTVRARSGFRPLAAE